MYATDFEYADKCLSDFGCIICSIDKGAGMEEMNIGCDITFNTVKNNHSSIHSKTSSAYDNVYTTSFQIAKDFSGINQEEAYFSYEEVRALYKWLNRRSYHKFKPCLEHDVSYDIHYYGSFNVDEVLINGKIAGLTLAFTANAPYGFGEEISLEFVTSGADDEFCIYGDSDEADSVIYPKVRIKCLAEGTNTLTITNQTTHNVVTIQNCSAGEIITMDGEHKLISSENGSHTDGNISRDFDYTYLDIQVGEDDYSKNVYKTSLPCELTITYAPIRKVGV